MLRVALYPAGECHAMNAMQVLLEPWRDLQGHRYKSGHIRQAGDENSEKHGLTPVHPWDGAPSRYNSLTKKVYHNRDDMTSDVGVHSDWYHICYWRRRCLSL